MRLLLTALTCALSPAIAIAQVGTVPRDLETYLLNTAKFSSADLAALEGGRVIARAASGIDDRELVVMAAVKIRAPRERVVAYYGQMVTYVDGQVTLAFSRFSTPPVLADVQTLTLDRDEIEALRACQPGKCDIRLGGASLSSLRSAVTWSAQDYGDQVHAFVRRAATDYAAAYLREGNGALVTYNDRSEPVSLQQQWQGLLASSPAFQQYYPELMQYLEQFPRTPLAGTKDVLYWVKENYGLKPVISIVHGVIYAPPQQADRTIVAQKQIYASHYYDGSLALASIVDASAAETPATFLVYVNRSRGDLLKGGFGGLKRNMARQQAQKAAEQTLGTIKSVLEQAGGAR